MTDRPTTEGAGPDLIGEILDLFLPFLDEPYSYQARQDRIDERFRKARALEYLFQHPSPAALPAQEPLDVEQDGGRIARNGWHYPYCWRAWVHVGMPLGGECECGG